MRLAADGERAHFQIGVTAGGAYEIRDASGAAACPMCSPFPSTIRAKWPTA